MSTVVYIYYSYHCMFYTSSRTWSSFYQNLFLFHSLHVFRRHPHHNRSEKNVESIFFLQQIEFFMQESKFSTSTQLTLWLDGWHCWQSPNMTGLFWWKSPFWSFVFLLAEVGPVCKPTVQLTLNSRDSIISNIRKISEQNFSNTRAFHHKYWKINILAKFRMDLKKTHKFCLKCT